MKLGGDGDGDANRKANTNLDLSNSAIPTGIVSTLTVFDKDSRVLGRIDANGSATACHFDALDRCDVRTFADGTTAITKYDLDDDVIQTTDPNGTIVKRAHDGAGRRVKVEVTQKATNLAGAGQSVVGSGMQAFEWDGRSRLRTAIDDNGASATLGVATDFTFDSLGRK